RAPNPHASPARRRLRPAATVGGPTGGAGALEGEPIAPVAVPEAQTLVEAVGVMSAHVGGQRQTGAAGLARDLQTASHQGLAVALAALRLVDDDVVDDGMRAA